MKLNKIIVGLLCAGFFIGHQALAAENSKILKCGKQAEAALLLVDYSGSMMQKDGEDRDAPKKVVEAKELIKQIIQKLPKKTSPAIGIGSIAPYNLVMNPKVDQSEENLESGLRKLPEDMEIFGRNTNLGQGILEIKDQTAPHEKNRKAIQELVTLPTLIIFSDDVRSNRGIEFKASVEELKKKDPNARVVGVLFGQKDEKSLHEGLDSVYDGRVLLENPKELDSFIKNELYRDCTFDLSSDTLFAFDSSKLTEKGKQEIRNVADQIKLLTEEIKLSKGHLSISAHTDRLGSDAYNQRLSERRLTSVLSELARDGVDLKLFKERRAMGESSPITKDECLSLPRKEQIQCYRIDRRVEIRLVFPN